MILHRLGLIHKNQRGFALLELVLVLAIMGLVATSINMTIWELLHHSTTSTNHMTATNKIQNVAYWISRDVQEAHDIVISDTTPTRFPITLTWTDWDSIEHRVDYTLEDMDGGVKKLQRNATTPPDSFTVAEYVNPDETSCDWGINEPIPLILTITITIGEESETRIYKFYRRSF